MRQRAMIAMAIANDPSVLVADEPTTALDVTIQAQILEVLKTAQRETHAAIVLITHDLGLIAELADRVVVMYAGRVVELERRLHDLRLAPPPVHGRPADAASRGSKRTRTGWSPIPGQPPSLITPPPGCAVPPALLLSDGRAICRTDVPELRAVGNLDHRSACHFAEELALPARGHLTSRSLLGRRQATAEPGSAGGAAAGEGRA